MTAENNKDVPAEALEEFSFMASAQNFIGDLVAKKLCTGGALVLVESNGEIGCITGEFKAMDPEAFAQIIYSSIKHSMGNDFADEFALKLAGIPQLRVAELGGDAHLMTVNISTESH